MASTVNGTYIGSHRSNKSRSCKKKCRQNPGDKCLFRLFARCLNTSNRKGFHPTSVVGRMGAAAAAATLYGLDAKKALNALSNAATTAGDLVGSFGTHGKPFQARKAAMDGILAADLADDGYMFGLVATVGVDAGPLSERICARTPRRMNRSESTSMTSTAFSFLDLDGDGFPRELIYHVGHADFPVVVRAILDEVVGPGMVGIFRPKPDARTVVQPQSAAFRLLVRHF